MRRALPSLLLYLIGPCLACLYAEAIANMESLISALALHGYSILFAAIFLEAIGLPVPAALALLIAGAASARGSIHASYALSGALLTMLAGDTAMFLMGRYTGWWLLGILCRISLNPESCILRSADSFYRRGRMLLVMAKLRTIYGASFIFRVCMIRRWFRRGSIR